MNRAERRRENAMYRRAARRDEAPCCTDCGTAMQPVHAAPKSFGGFPFQEAGHRRLTAGEAVAALGGMNIVEVSDDLVLPDGLRPRDPF